MMNCLLCLKIYEYVNKGITINSTEWQQLNVQYIVEKYLWKMEDLNTYSHICQECWNALNNFHNFYTEIKQAHANLNTLTKIKDIPVDAFNKNEEIINIESSHLEPQILLIKEEDPLDSFEKEFSLAQNIKHNRYSKKKCTNNIKNKTKRKSKKQDESTSEIIDTKNKKNEIVNIKLEAVEIDCKESNSNDNINNIDDTRFESDDEHEGKNSAESLKYYAQRLKYDKIIAEHLQITCSICHVPLETLSMAMKHYKEEHNQRGYALCCNRKLHTRSEIMDHINLHKNPDYLKCTYCEKILSSRACLNMHYKNVHDQKSFECDICGKSLSTEYTLKSHKLLHNTENNEKVQCNECDKSFNSQLHLTYHIRRVHLKKYHKMCEICGVPVDESQVKIHMLKHAGKSTVTCEICGRRLADKKNLKRHMNSHHPPGGVKREFKCPICMNNLASRNSLKMHIKVVHENSCESKCTMCEKTFKRPDALKDHMAKHIGEPLHACGWCPMKFYSNGQMHAHRKKVHPIEWQESVREKFSGNLPEKYILNLFENS